jgi:cytoskeletal protein RodZ
MRFGTTDRDVGLQRVSRLTRWLVAGTVGLAGVLSAVVAQALPGNSASSVTSGATSGATATPAAPTPASTTTTQDPGSSSGSGSSSSNDPTLTPTPPPVPTQHHSVARSGGS